MGIIRLTAPTVEQAKNTICLWYDKDAEEAASFYAATFPDSEVTAVHQGSGGLSCGKRGRCDHGGLYGDGHSVLGPQRRAGVQA